MELLFKKLDDLELSKSESCMLGWFVRAFLERSPFITSELLPSIESSFDCSSFRAKVMTLHACKYKLEKQKYLDEIQDHGETFDALRFYKPMVERAESKLKITDFYDLVASIENEYSQYEEIFSKSYENIHGEGDGGYISKNYKFLVVGCLLYDHYSLVGYRSDVLNNKCSSRVIEEYEKIGIDISAVDDQFSKYNILSVNEYIEILNHKDSQTILDRRINKYFSIP